jgi:hypothetical protein
LNRYPTCRRAQSSEIGKELIWTGLDLINVRAATLQAVKQQYAIVFPDYFGQISEARHQPGTVAHAMAAAKC